MAVRFPGMITVCLLAVQAAVSPLRCSAENWPGWRGPRGDGTSLEVHVPLNWDGTTGKNIRWKVAIDGEGHSSPIVFDNHVFVSTCRMDEQERVLLALDRRTGQTLWESVVLKSPLETRHALNSFASGTPATDGEQVYVTFLETDGSTIPAPNVGAPRPVTPGTIVVAAYDFSGKQQWIVRPGGFVSAHGFCSSPVLYRDLVIINGDHDGDSYVVALNRHDGKEVWRIAREHKTRSYVTPIIRDVAGKTQMVFSGSQCIVSIDPATGKPFWRIEGPCEQFVASMVFDGECFFMAAGFPTHHVMSIRPDGDGDVTESHVVWHSLESKCYVPSPVLAGGQLFVADDRGTASSYATRNGERIWRERLGSHFSASLITAANHVFFVADDGKTAVVRADAEPAIVSENPLGERSYASPAIAHGDLFIRGERHLFCIANTEAAAREPATSGSGE